MRLAASQVIEREMTTIGKIEIKLKLDERALRKVIQQEMTKTSFRSLRVGLA